jgi:hypothetical protein
MRHSAQVAMAVLGLAVVNGAGCRPGPPPPPAPVSTTTVVDSDCPPDAPFQETIPSTVDPANPVAGATVRFEVQARRLQVDVGPVLEARYWYPVPVGVARVIGVEFADGDPHTWEVQGGDLFVRFTGPDGGWLVNDFPAVTIVAALSPALRPGDRVAWKPYRRFEQHFVNIGRPLSCTVHDPDLVLQTMTVAAR